MTIQVYQSKGPRRDAQEGSSGTQTLLGAVRAPVAVLAAAHPSNPVLKALGEAVPQLSQAGER